MDYIDKVSVIDFAQLAMDCYNDPKDDEYRKQFNKLWKKVDQWPRNSWGIARDFNRPTSADEDPKSGFYANFYVNTVTNVGVMAIRGTDSLIDQLLDATYVLDKAVEQYDQALSFFNSLQKRYSNIQKFYVCGHSLGGIVSKMIAPRTGVNTIAFNSPGVVEYLKNRPLPYFKVSNSDAMCSIPTKQTIITYCANGCPIGNLRHDNDVGPYKWLPVKGEARIPDQGDRIDAKNLVKGLLDMSNGIFNANQAEFDKGKNEIPEFDKKAVYNEQGLVFLKYHLITDMYKALKTSEYKNDRI